MQWTSRQLVLPVLIASSVTGVCLTLLYLLYKKDDSDVKKSTRKTRIETTRQSCIECKVPKQLVPAIIGRGGSVIKDIQNKTSTQIGFENEDAQSSERICFIKGRIEGVQLAEAMIKNLIENQPIIETQEIFVPRRACRRIIGRDGETIREIQTLTNTKVILDQNSTGPASDPDAERRVIIKGSAEQIASAIRMIEEKVEEENEILANAQKAKSKANFTPSKPEVVVPARKNIDVIDLTKPEEQSPKTMNKSSKPVVEIDLTTPVKPRNTKTFIDNEKRNSAANENNATAQNLSNDKQEEPKKLDMRVPVNPKYAPAGYESDLSDCSDELEMY